MGTENSVKIIVSTADLDDMMAAAGKLDIVIKILANGGEKYIPGHENTVRPDGTYISVGSETGPNWDFEELEKTIEIIRQEKEKASTQT